MEFRNYKGWTSLLAVAFVDSFYLFVGADDVGQPGRSGDSAVLAESALLNKVKAYREAWLGEGGVIAADGAGGQLR
eukprot:scaffold224295_cov18-Tisochrysis_lutea.AAC.1